MNDAALTQRIIVPHDFSELAQQALVQALGIRREGDALHLVHALPRFDGTYPGFVWPIDEDEARRAHARRALEQVAEETGAADVVVHVLAGNPGDCVAQLAQEIGATLIILPSHGRTGAERVLLGSVAERVVRHAHCPVLVLRQ